jgi:ribosomal protein S18 acetylase RimI-like enzyme
MTTIRLYTAADGEAVLALQRAYADQNPGAVVVSPQVYASPGFGPGPGGAANIFVAADAGGCLLGYAPLMPVVTSSAAENALNIWATLKIDPAISDGADELRNTLLAALLTRAAQLRAGHAQETPGAAAAVVLECVSSETALITYAGEQGFEHRASAYAMVRPLATPIAPAVIPEGIRLRHWKMPTTEAQHTYLDARNAAFPRFAWGWDEFQYFMGSPLWAVGTSVAAFAGEQLVGNVLVYWDPDVLQHPATSYGYTEEIFVSADWRGRGLARAMITEALVHLAEHGLAEAHLQVNAANPTALRLYTDLGYEIASETLHLYRLV